MDNQLMNSKGYFTVCSLISIEQGLAHIIDVSGRWMTDSFINKENPVWPELNSQPI